MAPFGSTYLGQDRDESPRGGPIGALVIAIPLSLLLWGVVVSVLLALVR